MVSAASMSLSMRGRPFVGPSSVTVRFNSREPRDLGPRLPLDALFLVAERVDQRAKRGEAPLSIRIIPLDDRHLRSGHTRDRARIRPSSSPWRRRVGQARPVCRA